MCKITVVHNLINFQDHCISFALLQGILYFYPPKVPASGPLIYSEFSFVFASRQG